MEGNDLGQAAPELLAAIVRHAPLAMFVEDGSRCIVLWNPAAERMFGLTVDQAKRRALSSILQPSDALTSAVESVSKGREAPPVELVHRAADGREIDLRLSLTPLPTASGELRILYLAEDITQFLSAQRQHVRNEKMEAVAQLTGGIAHDFNNLLTVIIGNLGLLERTLKDNPNAQKLAQGALKAGMRGAEFTRQLLAIAHKQMLLPREIDVNGIVVSTARLLEKSLGDRIEVKLRLDQDLPPALADPTQLEAALVNLALNARDAMSSSGGAVTIETQRKCLDEGGVDSGGVSGSYVMIAISDTGAGMSPEVLRRAFEPFFTTKPVGKGAGLGLSVVHGFIRQSEGQIRIYSEPGYGTTVRLFLPCASEDEAFADAVADDRELDGFSAKILVVEDSAEVRAIVVQQLLEMGYEVHEAENADGALKILRKNEPIDLLFTDVVMPGDLNGVGLARAAKELRPGIKVLLTSGFANAAGRQDLTPEEEMELLSKPYRPQDLARKIREVLQKT